MGGKGRIAEQIFDVHASNVTAKTRVKFAARVEFGFDTHALRRENARMIRNGKSSSTFAAAPSAAASPLLGLTLLLRESGRCGSLVGA
jgi:hypothetical protein